MHIPTVLSVTDLDTAPRASARADLRDISRAETLRSPRAARTFPLQSSTAPSGPSTLVMALGGVALAVLVIVIWHIIAGAFDWPELRDFVAPTAAEARVHGWEALAERAAP
ncbi:hypothetical protein [Paracoccus sp. (in: a-proteobacteria)]|uniref:hypothetical protein n=1 Tax=Paracoccus sp. TaxID=267 RepID=UPI00289A08E1|nr:hypothetical protein [Paracoccus sp. (in: a-proteobacteria)]